MKKIILAALLAVAAISSVVAREWADETLHYKVMYKWGLINQQAGNVAVTIRNTPDTYRASLMAATQPWADRFYKVRDTLHNEISKKDFRPIVYTKRAHEGPDFTNDKLVFSYEGAKVIGDVTHITFKDGKPRRNDVKRLESVGTTIDMLTAFYYMRGLDYQDWQPGHVLSLTILSGKQKELLTIKYKGIERVEYDKKVYQCYKITFIFTSDGKTKSSDDMSAWIETDTRIPVKMEGKLPIGSVQALFTGKS